MSLNKAMLIGNVGKDPEVRYLDGNSQNGTTTKVATFPLATSERYRDRNGEQRENTEWHNIVVWRGLADVAEKFVRKGTQVYIEGPIRTRQWTDQSGNKRYSTEIVADTMQLLSRRPDQTEGGYQGQQGGYQSQPQGGYAPRPAQNAAPQQPRQDMPAGFAPQQSVDFSTEPSDDLPF